MPYKLKQQDCEPYTENDTMLDKISNIYQAEASGNGYQWQQQNCGRQETSTNLANFDKKITFSV